jgi:hypothetical protein
MDAIEKLKYQLAFSFLAPSIEGQREMTPAYQAHIETAKGLLEEVARGLETLATISNGSSAWNPEEVERAKEILALQGYDISHLSQDKIKEHAKKHTRYFRDRINLFEELIINPEAIYEKFPHRARLLNLCEDFKKFYADNHRVLGKEAQENVEDEYFLPVHGKEDGNAN